MTLVAKYLGDKLVTAPGGARKAQGADCVTKKHSREMRGETVSASPKSPGVRARIPDAKVKSQENTNQQTDSWGGGGAETQEYT